MKKIYYNILYLWCIFLLTSCSSKSIDYNTLTIVDENAVCDHVINAYNDKNMAIDNRYMAEIYKRISGNLNYYIEEGKEVISAVVILSLDGSGKVTNFYYEKKSGDKLFNKSIEIAINKSKPFPKNEKLRFKECIEIGINFIPSDIESKRG